MALSSIHVALVHSTDGTTYTKVSSGNEELCIKSVPDLDVGGNPDQIETTTLCDTMHQYIDGLKTLPETLEFTANYSPALFSALQALDEESFWGIHIGDLAGTDGKFHFKATCEVRLSGFGVGEVIEMTVILKPKSEIEFVA